MRHFSPILLSTAIVAVLAGCSAKTPPNPAAVDGPAAAAAPAQAVAEPVKAPEPEVPPSAHAALRDGIRNWVDLAGRCQRNWFRKVDPSKLDKWELPVDVPSMEDECDKLIFDHEALVKDNLFKGPELDELFGRMAMATDLYSHLAFRCRKVGVKDRAPFKQMLAGLRDSLGLQIEAIEKDSAELLKMPDETFARQVSGPELLSRADKWLGRAQSDMNEWIVKPRKEIGPVFKYSLKVSGRLAALSADALTAAGVDSKLAVAAAELGKAWTVVSDFYAGDYLAEEEAKSGFLQKSVRKAASGWEKAVKAAGLQR